MAGFVFKLEPVLRQRRMIEDAAQRELAQVLREKFILESQLRSTQESIREDKREIGGGLLGAIDVRRIRQHATHVGQVSIRARQIAGRLMGLERHAEQARNKLLKATRDRKAVELLEKRQRERWELEQRRRENAELDEMAVMAYGRKRRGIAL